MTPHDETHRKLSETWQNTANSRLAEIKVLKEVVDDLKIQLSGARDNNVKYRKALVDICNNDDLNVEDYDIARKALEA